MERRDVLRSQAAHAVQGALGGAEARVFGQEPFDMFGVVHTQDDVAEYLETHQHFVESIDGVNRRIRYRTVAKVIVFRDDLGEC